MTKPEQEPVAWLHRHGNFTEASMYPLLDDEIDRGWTQEPLYTAPPQRQWEKPWVSLTEKEIAETIDSREAVTGFGFARAIEAKLKEKNCG